VSKPVGHASFIIELSVKLTKRVRLCFQSLHAELVSVYEGKSWGAGSEPPRLP
jgi:hypothetical protein